MKLSNKDYEALVNAILQAALASLEKRSQQAYGMDSVTYAMRQAMYFMRSPESIREYAAKKLELAAYRLYGTSEISNLGHEAIKSIFKEAINPLTSAV